jgi:GWxTD domain-containing protein
VALYKLCLHYCLRTVVLVILGGTFAPAQDFAQESAASRKPSSTSVQQNNNNDPLTRPRTQKQEDAAKRERLSKPQRQFLRDVDPIISEEELQAFKTLGTNAERAQFIEDFWGRRNPHPDSEANDFKEEYYRRIAYANEHYAAGVPGARTDRGRVYLKYGKPDSIDAHPAGGAYLRTAQEGGGQTITYPFEIWRYRNLDDVGQEVEIEFVDTCSCGEYHMTIDSNEKDTGLHVPGVGPTDAELSGVDTKARRVAGGGRSLFGNGNGDQFEKLRTLAVVNSRPPAVNSPGLQANGEITIVSPHRYLPFDVRMDFLKVGDSVLMPITVQVPLRELTFLNKDGVQRGTVTITGRLRKLSGTTVMTFEDTVRKDIPAELLERELNSAALYWKALPVRPGRYRLDIVVKDDNGEKVGVFSRSCTAPDYSDNVLASSSLILADVLEPLSRQEVGAGNFALGEDRVLPSVPPSDGQPISFRKERKLNLWMQVYNLSAAEAAGGPSATVRYEIVNTATGELVVNFTEPPQPTGNVSGQVTLKKSLPLSKLGPGVYQVTVRVDDLVSQQTISPTAKFTVQ